MEIRLKRSGSLVEQVYRQECPRPVFHSGVMQLRVVTPDGVATIELTAREAETLAHQILPRRP